MSKINVLINANKMQRIRESYKSFEIKSFWKLLYTISIPNFQIEYKLWKEFYVLYTVLKSFELGIFFSMLSNMVVIFTIAFRLYGLKVLKSKLNNQFCSFSSSQTLTYLDFVILKSKSAHKYHSFCGFHGFEGLKMNFLSMW